MNKFKILAIETSCDDTACSIINEQGQILASKISSQIDDHSKYGGIVPELASRNHVVNLPLVIKNSLKASDLNISEIDAFAATIGPGLASSLLIGSTLAKSLAMNAKIIKKLDHAPFFGINHLEGHLLSPFILDRENNVFFDKIPPCVALVVSGGHTQIYDVEGFRDYKLIGNTRDDAAGEALDKAGKILNLPYPGGIHIDKISHNGDKKKYNFPRSLLKSSNIRNENQRFEFSFSGLKTSLLYKIREIEEINKELDNLCASYLEAVCDVLVKKILLAAKVCKKKHIAVSGGVSNNLRLREILKQKCNEENLNLFLADKKYTTDNAAMIAHCAYHIFKKNLDLNLNKKYSDTNNLMFTSLETDISPNLSIFSN